MTNIPTLFSQLTGPSVPWSDTSKWLWGLLGALGAVYVLFGVVLQFKKLFGRVPPLTDELDRRDKQLRKMIFASEHGLKERITRLEDLYTEMQADRLRKWDELQKEIREMSANIAFIRGERKGESSA